jgi:hypothetical protein
MIESLHNDLRLNSSRHRLLRADGRRRHHLLQDRADYQGWSNKGVLWLFCRLPQRSMLN